MQPATPRRLRRATAPVYMVRVASCGVQLTDNVATVANLPTRLATVDVQADANAAYRKGKIQRETLGAETSRNDTLLNDTGPRSTYKRAAGYIKTLLDVNEFTINFSSVIERPGA